MLGPGAGRTGRDRHGRGRDFTSLILGHAHPAVVVAVQAQVCRVGWAQAPQAADAPSRAPIRS
jgi:metallophosphoesterase superfamily enzyme